MPLAGEPDGLACIRIGKEVLTLEHDLIIMAAYIPPEESTYVDQRVTSKATQVEPWSYIADIISGLTSDGAHWMHTTINCLPSQKS